MNNTYTKTYLLISGLMVTAFVLVPSISLAQIATQDNGTSAASVPTTQNNGTSAGNAPTTQNNGTSAGTTVAVVTPSTQNNGTSAGSVPSTLNNGTSAGGTPSPTTPGTQNNGTSVGTIPTTQNNGTSAGGTPTVTTPGTQDNGTSAGNIPATQNNGTSAGGTPTNTNSSGNGNGSNTGGNSNTGSNGSNGGSTSSGGGSTSTGGTGFVQSGGGSSSYTLAYSGNSGLTGLSTGTQCPYLKDYLKISWKNSVSEVNKLQAFLKLNEKLDVDVTGIYDAKTFAAVQAFQTKYASEIMAPWGLTTPSGQVFFTTKKKINEIVCNSKFALTAEQIAQINAFKNSGVKFVPVAPSLIDSPTPSTIDTTPDIGMNENANNTAAVAKTPASIKIWNFIKKVFGR